MPLTTLQTVAIVTASAGALGLGAYGVKKARDRAKLREKRQGELPGPTPPACPEGLSPRQVDGEWQCLPVAPFEECLDGVYSHDRNALSDSIAGLLGENGSKTAAQFHGFHLSPEAMDEAYTVFAAALPGHAEPEELYYRVLADLMPCGWPLWGTETEPASGFTPQPQAALEGWPLDWNYYLEAPEGVTDRMEKAARSLLDLWFIALSQDLDQYLPVDVDPVSLVADAARDACARDDVVSPRAPGVPTSPELILGALRVAGYDPETQNVDEIMAQLESENPLLIDYLDADWRISAETQEKMWLVMLDVANFPRPVTNTVYNVQKPGEIGSCPWDEKDAYTINMAAFWYAAKRVAAIAELAGADIPVMVKEG